MPDKRKYRRLELDPLPCSIAQEGRLLELSIGGAFVTCERPMPKGSTLTLEVALGDRTIRVRTRVERVGDFFEGTTAHPAMGMGVSFIDIAASDRVLITQYLATIYGHATSRIMAILPARIRTGDTWSHALIRELGERSVFLATDAKAAPGTEVDVLLRLPNAKVPVEARGRVAPPGASDGNGDAEGLRIEFTEVGVKARDLLDAYLREAREDRTSADA